MSTRGHAPNASVPTDADRRRAANASSDATSESVPEPDQSEAPALRGQDRVPYRPGEAPFRVPEAPRSLPPAPFTIRG